MADGTVSSDMITAGKPRSQAQLAAQETKRKREAEAVIRQAQVKIKELSEAGGRRGVEGAVKMPWIFLAPTMGLRKAINPRIRIDPATSNYQELVRLNGGEDLIFREGGLATSDATIAKYIRESIRDGRMPGVTEDLTAFPLRCDHIYDDGSRCEFELPTSTKKDRDGLYLHFLNEHMGDMADRADLIHPIESGSDELVEEGNVHPGG